MAGAKKIGNDSLLVWYEWKDKAHYVCGKVERPVENHRFLLHIIRVFVIQESHEKQQVEVEEMRNEVTVRCAKEAKIQVLRPARMAHWYWYRTTYHTLMGLHVKVILDSHPVTRMTPSVRSLVYV